VLDEFAEVEEGGLVGTAGCLLHVVGDDDDRELFFEVGDEFLDFDRGDGLEGGAGLVHEEDGGLHGDGAGDAQTVAHGGLSCLWIARIPNDLDLCFSNHVSNIFITNLG
jgi:hypothetical protein